MRLEIEWSMHGYYRQLLMDELQHTQSLFVVGLYIALET